MSDPLQKLALRIRNECDELARLVERAREAMSRAGESSDDLYLDSVALNLHGFYAGLERLFELIGSTVDGNIPRGENWHQTLLEQMATEIPSVRPALISENSRQMLDEYRGFRHVVRNVYAFRLDPAKVQGLVEGVPAVFSQVHAELLAFADFLAQQARE